MKYVLLLCFAIISGSVFSEDTTTSIYSQLEQADSIRSSNPEQFVKELQNLKTLEKSFSKNERDYFLYLKAYHTAFQGKHEEAVASLEPQISDIQKIEIKFRAHLLITNISAANRNFVKGLTHLETALSLADEIQSEPVKQLGYAVAALLYNQLEQFELGLNYSEKLISESPSGRNLCMGLQLKLEALLHLSRLKIEDPAFADSIAACTESNSTVIEGFVHTYYASLLLQEGQDSTAEKYMLENLKQIETTKYNYLLTEFYSMLSQAFFNQQKLIDAKEYAKKVIKTNQSENHTKPLALAYKILFEIAQKENRFEEALSLHKLWSKANSDYINDVKAKELAYQLAKHNIREKEATIELLNEKNNVLNLEKKLAKEDSRSKTLMVIILAMLIVFTSLWAYRTRKTHVKLRKLAEFDSLTGISNRGHFSKQAEENLQYSAETSQGVSFLLFDLDKFKNINDSFGHPVGDWVLKKIPVCVNKVIRKIDLFGRMGGEEFAILLNGCDLNKAREIAEQIRKELVSIHTKETGHQFKVSASFGITDSSLAGYSLETLISQSDEALYESKRAGRNQVSVYSHPPDAND